MSFAGAVGQPDPPSQSFDVLSDLAWHATTSADWIQVSPDSGRGNTTLEVSIRPLLLVGDIADTIYIAAGSGVAQLPVHLHRTGKPPRGLLYGIPYVDPVWGQRDSIFLASPDGSSPHPVRFPNPSYPLGPDQFFPITLPFWGPVFSPGGDSLVFLAPAEGVDLYGVATPDGAIVGGEQLTPGFCLTLTGGLNWSPDGRRLAWTCRNHGGEWIVVTGQPPLPLTRGNEATPSWSPDGTWLLVGRHLVSADGTPPEITLSASLCCGIGWTPDNQIITLGPPGPTCGTGVLVVPRGGGPPRQLLGPEYNYAAFSPDGKKLLARRCAPSPAIELMDADGTNVTWTMPGADWAAWQP